jgi:hypothetical protein
MTDFNIRETRVIPITSIGKDRQPVTEEYKVTQLNAESGLRYMKKVQKLVLPVWAEAIKAAKNSEPVEGEDSSQEEKVSFADIILKVSDRIDELDEKDITALVCESLSITPAKYNEMFRGKYFALIQLVKEIVMFNFEDVFLALGLERF